jgi:hypothetical protein
LRRSKQIYKHKPWFLKLLEKNFQGVFFIEERMPLTNFVLNNQPKKVYLKGKIHLKTEPDIFVTMELLC